MRSNTGGYSMNIHYYPTGICKRCAILLSGKRSVPENMLRLWHTPITFKTEKDCKECTVCSLASSSVKKIDRRKKGKEKRSLQLCVDCFGEIGPGKHNRCTKQSKASNLQKHLMVKTPLKSREQLTNTLLKNIYNDKESPEGKSISLSGQRGRPVPVTLGLQQKPTLDKITVEDIMKIKKGLKGSLRSRLFTFKN